MRPEKASNFGANEMESVVQGLKSVYESPGLQIWSRRDR
jgi:hypothetical protein